MPKGVSEQSAKCFPGQLVFADGNRSKLKIGHKLFFYPGSSYVAEVGFRRVWKWHFHFHGLIPDGLNCCSTINYRKCICYVKNALIPVM